MTLTDSSPPAGNTARAQTLSRIEHRVLWLSAAMVHAANTGTRKDPDGLKVGGHQASSASMVSIMTALWFAVLRPHYSTGSVGIGATAPIWGAVA